MKRFWENIIIGFVLGLLVWLLVGGSEAFGADKLLIPGNDNTVTYTLVDVSLNNRG